MPTHYRVYLKHAKEQTRCNYRTHELQRAWATGSHVTAKTSLQNKACHDLTNT